VGINLWPFKDPVEFFAWTDYDYSPWLQRLSTPGYEPTEFDIETMVRLGMLDSENSEQV
jgi:hypothetical protein